jgi:DNA-binding NtrC family response regulator
MSDNDKQMIVKAILDLKGEVDRLKSIVEAGGATPVPATLPHYVGPEENEPEEQQLDPDTAPIREGLSIRKAGDELIERALAKHAGKVKAAAAELGISERTIYRKLAEWKEKGKKI